MSTAICREEQIKNKYKIQEAKSKNPRHLKGLLTARERIEILVDKNSFEEFGSNMTHNCSDFGMENKIIEGDGVIVGNGLINGRLVCIYSQDFSSFGGSLGLVHAKKICYIMDLAEKLNCPIIGINDSGGARIQEGIDSLCGYGEIFRRNVELSGVVPQISLIMGPCAGGAVYSPALCDFIFMNKHDSFMFVTGPNVVKSVMYEEVTKEELGGSDIHSNVTGIADKIFENDVDLLLNIRSFFKFIPSNNSTLSEIRVTKDDYNRSSDLLDKIIPKNSTSAYNMHSIISEIVDEGEFFEIKEDFAQNIIIGFSYIGGKVTGIIANNTSVLAGCLEINSSRKAARFIRFCDAFSIQILTLIDVPGFMPGVKQEHGGIIVHGAKMLYAYAEATVPKVSLIVRKAYGGAYIAMGSKHLYGDINYSWKNVEIAVMGAAGAAEIIFKRHAEDKDKMASLMDEYQKKTMNASVAASKGYVDKIIEPSKTRGHIIRAFDLLKNKKVNRRSKKHCNIPL